MNVASCNSLGCLKAEIGENSKPIRQCFTSVRSFQWHHQVQALISEYKWIGFSAPISNHNRAMAMAFKALLTSFVPIPSRFPTDSSNFSVFSSSHFPSKLAHWPIGSGRPCCITQLTVPEAQGSRNNKLYHPFHSSKLYQFCTQCCMASISISQNNMGGLSGNSNRPHTNTSKGLQCVRPVGINQILPPSSFCWGGIVKPLCLRPGTLHLSSFVITVHLSIFINYLIIFSSARSTV